MARRLGVDRVEVLSIPALPDIGAMAALAAARAPPPHPPEPLYLRKPDVKPQADLRRSFRMATPADATLLAGIHAEAFETAWTAEALAAMLAMPGALCFLAIEGAEPAGFLLARSAADETEIVTLAVRPVFRRRGVARALLGALVSALQAPRRVFLEVAAGNAAALALYRAAGFAEAGMRRGYYARANAAPEDALILQPGPRAMSRARAFLKLSLFAGLTLPLMPVQQLFVWTSPGLARRFPHWYHRAACKVLGIEIRVTGRPVTDRACLIACNHVSWMDIPVLSAALPVSFIAKREVAKWPFFGSLARLQRTVFVDRDRRHATGQARDEMGWRLKRGDQLVLFAEGTSNDGNRVKPFRSAFFGAAETEGVSVQPVTLAYADVWGLPMTRRYRPSYAWYGGMDLAPHLFNAIATGPVTVEVTFHPPLEVLSAGGRKAVAQSAERTVRQHLLTRLARGRAAG